MPQSETERGKEIYLYFILARLQFRSYGRSVFFLIQNKEKEN